MAFPRSRQGRDRPNYRTLTHRRPFLILLFLLVCGLLAALEWMLSVIPSATERTSIPNEFHPLVPIGEDEKQPTLYHIYDTGYQTPTQPSSTVYEPPSSTRDSNATRLTTTSSQHVSPRETSKPREGMRGRFASEQPPEGDPDPRLSSELYASIGMTMRTHVTWADYWIPDPAHRGNRVPVSAEEATAADHCVFIYKGVATTRNESACTGEITFELRPRKHDGSEYDRFPGPVRFDKPECTRDYVRWLFDETICSIYRPGCSFFTIRNCWRLKWNLYEGGPNKPGAPRVTNVEPTTEEEKHSVVFSEHEDLALYYYDHLRVGFMWDPHMVLPPPEYYESLIQAGKFTVSTSTTTTPKITPRRYDEQTLQFYQEWRGRATQTLSYHGVVYRPIEENWLRTFTNDAPSTLTSPRQVTTTSESTGISSHTSSASTVTTSISSGIPTSTRRPSTVSDPSRAPPSYLPPPPSSVIPVAFTQTILSTRSILTGSTPTTRTYTYTDQRGAHTSTITETRQAISTELLTSTATIVALVPVAWKPASAITTRTNSRGEPTTTELDYGGDPIVGHPSLFTTIHTWTDLTNVEKQYITTETIQAIRPISSRLSTLIDNAGSPTATATEYPVLPSGIPSGDRSTMLKLARSEEYFAIFFLPIILSALVSVPVQMLDAEVRLLMPFRSLVRLSPPPSSSFSSSLFSTFSSRLKKKRRGIEGMEMGSQGRNSLCLRTRGWGARKDALRLLWRHGDWVPFATYLLVIATTALVAMASETVGVKLRGSCTKTDAQGCFLTVATFTGPARTVEALLGVMLVLIGFVGVSLARWRSGVATHPGSVAVVCALLQNPAAVGLLRSVRLDFGDGEDGGGDGDGDGVGGKRRKTPGSHQQLVAQLGDKRFALAWDSQAPRGDGYGLVVVDGDEDVEMVATPTRDRKLPASPNTTFFRQDGDQDEEDNDTSSRYSSHHRPTPSETASTTELIRPPSPVTPIPGIKHRPTFTTRIDHLTSHLHVHTKPQKDNNPHKTNPIGAAFLLIHLSLLTLILYYELTVYGSPDDSPFEAFMDSQEFGVRLLFSSLGTLLAFFWEDLFADVVAEEPYLLMSSGAVDAEVLLRAQPTSALEALWQGVFSRSRSRLNKRNNNNPKEKGEEKKRGKNNTMIGRIALAGVLNKLFAPVLLSNIPFQISQTWTTHEICVWLSVAVLGYSSLVLGWYLFGGRVVSLLFPSSFASRISSGGGGGGVHLPVHPQTLAGRMYYVCDSAVLSDFARLSMLSTRRRDERVLRLGRRYRFGDMVGVSGRRRVGVDYAPGFGGASVL